MRIFIIMALTLMSFYACDAFCDEPVALERIVLTSSRAESSPESNSASGVVMSARDLDRSPAHTVFDQLGECAGVDIRRRGPAGIQSDVSLRAATFEESSILIDGIRMNDPQTGHYSTDIPLTSMDIDAAEVLRGPASVLYGPNAFGGAVNISTKRPGNAPKLIAWSEGGSFDEWAGGVSVSYPAAFLKSRTSIESARSTGYMPETDYSTLTLYHTSNIDIPLGSCDFSFGYLKKDFGAANFYSNLYPNEEEHTDTRFFAVDGIIESGALTILPKCSLRRHGDKFQLDRNRPGWQTNYHTTYTYAGELGFKFKNDKSDLAYGFEVSRDTIDSTSMSTHHQEMASAYIEFVPHLGDRLHATIGVREDYFSVFGWQCSPAIGARYAFSGDAAIRGRIGRAYRIPTFTDRYYRDAANIGNPDLCAENAWSYEVGCDYKRGKLEGGLTYFYRDSHDLIDWARQISGEPWRAMNIGEAKTNGCEASVSFLPGRISADYTVEKLTLRYTVLDTFSKHDYISKYAFDYLKQQITGIAALDLLGFKNEWVLNYKKRIGDSGFIIVDASISKELFKKSRNLCKIFFDLTNIFNIDYSEQSDIPMPGRAFRAGARIEF